MNYKDVDALKNAMKIDVHMHNEDTGNNLCSKVREMDVSDCPDLPYFVSFETTEDCMDDLAHEMLMQELNEYAS